MRLALREAERALEHDDVPVGAVVTHRGEVAGLGRNERELRQDPTAHAEMLAIRAAAHAMGNYRLEDVTLYVTLEPCAMCAGALVQARIRRLVFGARDLRFGGVRSKFQLADSDLMNHRVEVVEGVMAADCMTLLQEFFRKRR